MEGVCKEQRKHKATHLSGTMRIRIQTISNLGIHISQSPELAPNEIEINTLKGFRMATRTVGVG
jgi:hypothetical protein